MPQSRFSQRIRNKLNRSKEAEVPQILLQQLQPFFLPRNRQQVPAQKALKDAESEGLLQTVEENGQRKKPNEKKEQKKNLNRTERPITIQILQRQRRQRRKQKKCQDYTRCKKILKTKFATQGPTLFGSVQNLKEESKISRIKVKQF